MSRLHAALEAGRHAQRRLTEAVRVIERIDVRPFETAPVDRILGDLVPATLGALDHATGTFEELLSSFGRDEPNVPDEETEEEGRNTGVFYIEVDDAVRKSKSPERVADLAFVGLMQVRAKRGRLVALPARPDPWNALGACGSGLRSARKTCGALDAALCEVFALEPALTFVTELELSLAVRRQYAQLRRVVSPAREPDERELRPRLRTIGNRIAALVCKPIYPELRVHDRIQLRSFQTQILSFMRSAGDPAEGLAIWRDISAFAGVLAQVNRRQELVEHDRRALAELSRAVELLAAGRGEIDVLALTASLEGLDDGLDALLARRERDARAWIEVVRSLAGVGAANEGFG